MELGVNKKIAIVTGGGGGIGRAIAFSLSDGGATVEIADIDQAYASDTVSIIKAKGGTAGWSHVDIRRETEVDKMAEKVISQWGRIDFLINNAGVMKPSPLAELNSTDLDLVIDTNVKGTILCTRSVLPFMIKRRFGRIVNISSAAGKVGVAGNAVYSASKAALIGLTKALAREVAEFGITVNAVAPGPIEGTSQVALMSPEVSAKNLASIPLGRRGRPEEVANMVLYLTSELSSYVTGQCFSIDGGRTMC